MARRIRIALVAIAAGFVFSLGAAGQTADDIALTHYWRLCANDVIEIPPETFEEWVPVGCEAVDCCPGCPGVLNKLDWRIQVVGAPLESLSISFKRLPGDVAAALKLGGTAQGTADRMLIGKGAATITGLPVEIAARAPVAQIEVTLNRSWVQEQAAKTVTGNARASGTRGPASEVTDISDRGIGYLIVEQFVGRYRVNEFKVKYHFQYCPKVTKDRIVLHNNTSADNASLLLDANRPGGCVLEESRRGSGVIGVGDVLANSGCRSEVVVFSDDDAMQLTENVSAWTNSPGDTLDIDMAPRVMAPVAVWVVRPGAFQTALDDMDHANLLYNTNNSGIGFTATFQDVSANAEAVAIIGSQCADDPTNIENSPYFEPGQLNVYYVSGGFTGCNPDDDHTSNTVFIGTSANNQTLAHEFGHSMGLGHTNGGPANNIMVGGGQNRTHFYDGQSFRMNANCGSSLNKNGVRVGPIRHCYDEAFGGTAASCPIGLDTHCPNLNVDALPK